MKTITHTATLPFTTEQMYNLVNDIEKYPDFLPWCKRAEIIEKKADKIEATLTVAKGGFEKSIRTINLLKPNESMELTLVAGPFDTFSGLWQFETVEDNQCKATYTMTFEFDNFLVSMVATPIFTQIADTMIEAFKARAEKLYSDAS